ncbi:Mitochondrial escape protein 2-like protein [Frankliniella fusca]|uniref:Mitochondrial escape protein 2-like protein n=1 Tax=Frankliniella fusca TaxID=407009 RepID=A0AAE1LD35_9NEOP|nr:Mitochondrial escape protein 2-like protein [Frankliniella fusca]
MDLRFSHPSNVLVCAPSGGGKTHLVKRVVENRYNMFNVSFVKVVWYYSEYQGAYDELAQKHGVEFIEGAPSMDHFPSGEKPKLVIVDDFLDQIKNPEFLKNCDKGVSPSKFEFLAHYVILLKSPRDIQQIRTLALQVDPANWRGMLEAYLDATQEGHSYILFDFHVRQQDHLRLRTHIFPGENTVVYIPNGKYKKSLIFQK